MTLYSFCNRYLEEQTPPQLRGSLSKYYEPIIFGWDPYFAPCPEHNPDINVAMNLFAHILQNRAGYPKYINYAGKFERIRDCLHNFDTSYIAGKTANQLFDELKETVEFSSSVDKSWKGYSQGLVESAQYLLTHYKNYEEYISLVSEDINGAIEEISEIHFMGPALARNYLKEIGIIRLGKPDTYLYDVYLKLNHTQLSFDDWLEEESAKDRVSPYKLDRMIWLIMSGAYFMDGVQLPHKKTLRDNFLSALGVAAEKGEI